MFYGKVIGSVVCTVKDEQLTGMKLQVVQPTNYKGESEGNPIVAADTVCAGVGDFVYLAKGKESSMPFGDLTHPLDAGIIGIIDNINVDASQSVKPKENSQ